MPSPRVIILRAPGTNCDSETAFAFETAGGTADVLHVNRVLENPALFDEYQILCVPGGFSYGDDIAAGRIFAKVFEHHLGEALQKFRDDGKLILGICNGFQVLLKAGVLLGGSDNPQSAIRNPQSVATLAWNDSGKFEDRWVRLSTMGDRSVFLEGVHSMYLPIAHAEGKFVARDGASLDALDGAEQLVLRYTSSNSAANGEVGYPDNPNGSTRNVAGVSDLSGRVLGLMPHPERHLDPTQHPRFSRGEAGEVGDGLAVFQNAVDYFK